MHMTRLPLGIKADLNAHLTLIQVHLDMFHFHNTDAVEQLKQSFCSVAAIRASCCPFSVTITTQRQSPSLPSQTVTIVVTLQMHSKAYPAVSVPMDPQSRFLPMLWPTKEWTTTIDSDGKGAPQGMVLASVETTLLLF